MRFEELPGNWFDYNNAFPTVTGFYSSPPVSHPTPTEATAGELLSSDMDTTNMAEGKKIK